jgi:hypothetical protein
MTDLPAEETALAHASADGHVCGRESAMRVFASAAVQQLGAAHVFVEPEYTFVLFEGGQEIVRYRNAPEMIEALDQYLLTGELPRVGAVFRLLAP